MIIILMPESHRVTVLALLLDGTRQIHAEFIFLEQCTYSLPATLYVLQRISGHLILLPCVRVRITASSCQDVSAHSFSDKSLLLEYTDSH